MFTFSVTEQETLAHWAKWSIQSTQGIFFHFLGKCTGKETEVNDLNKDNWDVMEKWWWIWRLRGRTQRSVGRKELNMGKRGQGKSPGLIGAQATFVQGCRSHPCWPAFLGLLACNSLNQIHWEKPLLSSLDTSQPWSQVCNSFTDPTHKQV